LNRVVGSAERCHRIVQSLLSFARAQRPERKMTEVNAIVESTIEIFRYEIDSSDIDVITQLSANIPSLLLDPHQIQQVFLNILNNSRQAMEAQPRSGIIRVTSKLEGDHVRIIFQDNGPGISAENLSKIFNPFFTTKPVGEGTGLGLSLAYGIVREHGGTITAESPPGGGVTFTIDLPVSSLEQEVPQQHPGIELQKVPEGHIHGSRILVIDDEENILDLIQEALKASGYQVDVAADGQTAIQLAERDAYDLIICDWKIPDMGGELIYQRLRELKLSSTPRFIFITGDILSQKAEQFLQREGKICLFKPFSVEQFRTKVQEVLTLPY
jgi:CheY-like chemotaxis protein